MKALVIGGTGTVGSQVVRQLLARGVSVHVLTRSPERLKGLPAGADAVVGDLLSPSTVRSAFAGIDGVFMLNAVSTTEAHEGLMAVNGARLAGVGRFVYMSIHNLGAAPHLPHFGAKIPVEIALVQSRIPYTILRPNNFFQNDYWYKDALLQYALYPQPMGEVGISRVDVRDIAEAAAIALTTDGHQGQTYNLVGPDALTGSATAAFWTRALGKPVAYGGDDLDVWEQQSLQYLPPWMVFDFRLMYDFFQKQGLKGTASDIKVQTKLLGHPPRNYAAFVAETAKVWKT